MTSAAVVIGALRVKIKFRLGLVLYFPGEQL